MYLKVSDIEKRLGVDEHAVLGWIKSGELKAVNVGRSPGKKRPRWRISEQALAEFEATRSSGPALSLSPRRRKKRPADVVQFYPTTV